ncbi:MAG: S8 family serine peptidase [Acidobacteriota bacterium]
MSQDLNAALSYFFGSFLSEGQRRTLSAAGERAKIRIGNYTRYAGSPVAVVGGEERMPKYAVGVGPELPAGDNGVPSVGDATVGQGANQVFLLWLREVADIQHDSAEEIERVMSNVDFYAPEGSSANAAAWAEAIAGTADRASLAVNFFDHEEVPAGFESLAESVQDFRETLHHFFTFAEDGEYYERWSGSGREVPDGLSSIYRQRNIVELQLKRYDEYIYSLVPARFLNPSAAADSGMREVVWGFRRGDDGAPAEARVLLTVPKDFGNAGDFYDFVAFEAEEGEGAALPVTARSAVDARLADFLQDLPEEGEARSAALRNSTITTDNDEPAVKVFAQVAEGVTLPDGVRSIGTGPTQMLLVPPERVTELAALEGVDSLEAPKPLFPRLGDVRPMVNLPALEARVAAADRGGAGVVVGVVDSGLDAQHPAFAGRVLGVWDIADPAGPTPASAWNAGNSGVFDGFEDAIRSFFWDAGTEFTGPTVTNARDTGSHGTHVTGIAAGAAVTGSDPLPAGMAPRADIVAVHRGRPEPDPDDQFSQDNRDISDWDTYTAIAYILEKARRHREGTPVVVNMSFGHHDHAHDGTAALSRSLNEVSQLNNSARPGFAMVAAAGNERSDQRHIQRSVGASATRNFDFDLTGFDSRSRFTEVVTVWVTNPDPDNVNNLALDVTTRQPGSATAVTPTYSQQATHSPSWQSFWGQGVHVGTSFGPRDPHNNDFNVRVRLQTAVGIVPDPAGTVNFLGANWRRVRLDRDWNISGTTTQIWGTGLPVALGPSTANGLAGFLSIFSLPAPSAADLTAFNNLTTGRWRVSLRNRTSGALDFHVWAGRENAQFRNVGAADISHLICTPAEADGVISVASCNANLAVPNPPGADIIADGNPEGAITSFSSPGPLRNQATNPGVDITAPGNMIISARSQVDVAGGTNLLTVNANAVRMAGTSMASPAVAGIIANIMAEEPNLTIDQIRTRFATCSIPTTLRDGTTAMPATAPTSANDWGEGLIDANRMKP